MNCMESQELIMDFINNKLEMGKLVSFLDHIKSCEICREELEVYYTIFTAMQQLDDDKELSNNYSKELKQKLEYQDDRIRRQRMQKVRRRFSFLFIILGMGILTGIQIGEKIIEDTTPKPEVRIEPSFMLTYSGVPDIMKYAEAFIEENDINAKQYTIGRKKIREYIWRKSYLESRNRLKRFNIEDDGGINGK